MAKLHYRSYNPNQIILFPQRIDEDIAGNDPVRIISAIIDRLDLSKFHKLYHGIGRCAYHPRMMLKVIVYAYMNNIYSCRKIEKLLHRDIHFIWLSGCEKPDFITINRFRNRVKEEISDIFTQIVLLLSAKGFVSLDVEYVDGTKIESKANKYTFVWRKTVERNRTRLLEKIKVLLEQVDEAIAQDKCNVDEKVEFTPTQLSEISAELNAALSSLPATTDREEKKRRKGLQKTSKELERHSRKLSEYNQHLDTLGERNSYSKTDKDATFMRMKEDAMNNGQTKPGYNLQIGTEKQFITDFALFPNPTDTLTYIPFMESFKNRYGAFPSTEIADSGYGAEENYRFMEERGIEAFVKYNRFHIEQRPRYVQDPFRSENFYYNEKEDYCVCPKAAGNRISERNHRLEKYKRQAFSLLTSDEGLKQRGRRCIEPEAVFGQMKFDMAYRRFRHFGKDKVTMDFAFFAIAFNLKKMIAKMNLGGLKHNLDCFKFIFYLTECLCGHLRVFDNQKQRKLAA